MRLYIGVVRSQRRDTEGRQALLAYPLQRHAHLAGAQHVNLYLVHDGYIDFSVTAGKGSDFSAKRSRFFWKKAMLGGTEGSNSLGVNVGILQISSNFVAVF